ncbi:pentatricopeptide repeat-containing protein At3g13160, mitochondrial [Ricinus communis]|uniref:pentatricopeptide repeat-containing protein At3g13160, mitochondrial n=1 Tax=Ricinus communis TaxID=3988 RepID=UPI00201AD1FC|nr:pentatricopeptide repeat-containing protein At3g13160, mitochondrial [Ricinus communis]
MAFVIRLLSRTCSTSTQLTTGTAARASSVEVLYKERNLKRLVEKFKKFSENDRFRTKTGIYEETIRRLAIAKRFNWIEEILEDQKKYKDIHKEGYNARLIRLYGKSNMFDNSRKVFDEMPDRNCKRTVVSFNALLAACVTSKKFDEVDGLFRKLPKELEIKPDTVSYNTVIKGYCEMGALDKAISLLVEMEMKGNPPDLITFNTLLNGFYSNGLFVDGERIWSQMVQKSIVPDIRSYNAKLLGLALVKRTKDAVLLLQEMKSKGIKPDVISFNALIKGFVKEENLEEAKYWYCETRNSGGDCGPDKFTFTTLIPFVCEKGDLRFAFELSKDVISRKCLVDMALLKCVVEGLVKESKIQDANELVKLGMNNGYCRYQL